MIKINILSECEFIFRAYLKRFARFGEKEFARKIYDRRLVPSICIPATGCSINFAHKKTAKASQNSKRTKKKAKWIECYAIFHFSRVLIHNTIELM